MSIKLMSAIFDAEMIDLPCTRLVRHEDGTEEFIDYSAKASTAKLVLLAIADHANDYGMGAFPGLAKLKKKTCLSKQGIIDTIEALRANGLLSVAEQPSILGTNDYTVNIAAFPKMADEAKELTESDSGKATLPDVVKPLDRGGKATLPDVVKPLDHNHQLTTTKPPINHPAKKGDLLDAMLAADEMPGAKKAAVKQLISEKIKSKLGLNPSGKDAESFIEYAATQHKKGNSFDAFLEYWITNNPKPEFWSFRRMEQFYDRAFQPTASAAQSSVIGGVPYV